MTAIDPTDGTYYVFGGDVVSPTNPLYQVQDATPTLLMSIVAPYDMHGINDTCLLLIQPTPNGGIEALAYNPQKNESKIIQSVAPNILTFDTEATTYDATNEILYGCGINAVGAYFNVWNLRTGSARNFSLSEIIMYVVWNPTENILYGVAEENYYGPCTIVVIDVNTGAYQNVTESKYPIMSRLLLDDEKQVIYYLSTNFNNDYFLISYDIASKNVDAVSVTLGSNLPQGQLFGLQMDPNSIKKKR